MIFKKLILKNFMSYSNAEVDLSGVHVACLIGENGAGKSSLLDAITWTIWEEGRARTDELIKLGRNEMSCEIDFHMEDTLYRVYRSRNKSLKNAQGKSNLEFQVLNPTSQEWTSLTLSSTRQTQELIIKTLNMDYPTFVNSVYLRQGKADEFTVKRPNERKQILADILGLEVYDRLSDLARDKTKEAEQKVMVEENLISSMKEKILKEEEFKSSIEQISKELSINEQDLKKVKDILNLKQNELNEKKEKEKQVALLEKSKQNQESLINYLNEQLKNFRAKEEKFKDLINNKDQIKTNYDGYLKLQEQLEIIEENKEKHNRLTLEKSYLEQDLKEKISKAEQDLAVYKTKLNERKNSKTKLSENLKNEEKFSSLFNRAEEEIKTFKTLQESLTKIETEGLELKHKKELVSLEINALSGNKKEIKSKIETLNSHTHAEPCPLCKSPIKDKNKVIESFNAELKSLEKAEKNLSEKVKLQETELKEKRLQHAKTKEQINDFNKTVLTLITELQKINQNTKQAEAKNTQEAVSYLSSQLEISKNEFDKAKEQIILLDKEIGTFEKEVNSLNTFLTSGSQIKEITEKIKNISTEIQNTKYTQEEHNELKSNIKKKETAVATYDSLKQAESESVSISQEIQNLNTKMSQTRHELDELLALINNNKKQTENINLLEKEVFDLKQKEEEKNLKLNKIKKSLIVNEQSLKEIQELKKLTKEKENKIKDFLNNKKQFEILEKAFSKKGIQVAIIETVVPEIEKEANRILNRLTENQMHVALKTQREKKSTQGLTETLDVVIADNLGTRNYELYSGGEAFKIDFAIRLALSRLLANRASAKLQTLIIDEGFGSQDDAGKERLVEVIKSIQNEFELILVVTHLDELKEAFPAQIHVSKDEEGSRVRLVA